MVDSDAGLHIGCASDTAATNAGWAQATLDELLDSALSLLGRLAQSNLRSLAMAKQLMVAQELTELRSSRAEWAVDQAAGSGGDPEAIESAVAAVAAAERADAEERVLALSWAVHRREVSNLAALADELIECRAGGRTRRRVPGEGTDGAAGRRAQHAF